MKTLYLANTGYSKKPTIPCNAWVKRDDFMDIISSWQVVTAAQAKQAIADYDVLAVHYEQLQGYCSVACVHAVHDSTGTEIDKIANALQREQDKHKAKVALYDSLLQHLLHMHSE